MKKELKQLTEKEIKNESISWLNSEGYDEDGNEYNTLAEWVNRHNRILNPLTSKEETAKLAIERGDY